jgi:signal transduction histidine kinase
MGRVVVRVDCNIQQSESSEIISMIRVSVSDNGIGIDAKDISNVQDRFYRADESRQVRSGGRGIGLSIVRSIVEAHNGSVRIESEGIGKGTKVCLSFPC